MHMQSSIRKENVKKRERDQYNCKFFEIKRRQGAERKKKEGGGGKKPRPLVALP